MKKVAISLTNISFNYPESNIQVFDKLSLDIFVGEYVCILGHNGSGKSTLSKIIMGLEKEDNGDLKILGRSYTSKTIYEIRKNIAIVFQNPDNQFIGSTVEDDIAFGLENHQIEPNKMKNLIDEFVGKVNMTAFMNFEPHKLSGGQKQRVAIAGILAISPSIIIFDESTSMLDPKGKKEVNRLIRNIAQKNKITVVTITHDMEEAASADRIVVLNKGKIVMDGTPENIFKQNHLVTQYQLDVPFATKMKNLLNFQGIKINTESIHLKELLKCL